MNKIISYLTNLFGENESFFLNFRGWDYEQILEYGEFKSTDVVLDTGAFHTFFSIYLSQFVKKIYVTDNFYWYKRAYVKEQQLMTKEEWMDHIVKFGKGKTEVEEADIMELPYPDETFNKVLCISTIEHVLDDAKGLKELMRVVKKGGHLLLTTEFNPTKGKDYDEVDGSFYRIYSNKSLNDLIGNLNVVERESNMEEFKTKDYCTLFLKIKK